MREGYESKVCQNGISPGSKAHTECKNGKRVTGDKTRTCGHDGQWSGEPSQCEGEN